jgi:signal transduction histidine kinase
LLQSIQSRVSFKIILGLLVGLLLLFGVLRTLVLQYVIDLEADSARQTIQQASQQLELLGADLEAQFATPTNQTLLARYQSAQSLDTQRQLLEDLKVTNPTIDLAAILDRSGQVRVSSGAVRGAQPSDQIALPLQANATVDSFRGLLRLPESVFWSVVVSLPASDTQDEAVLLVGTVLDQAAVERLRSRVGIQVQLIRADQPQLNPVLPLQPDEIGRNGGIVVQPRDTNSLAAVQLLRDWNNEDALFLVVQQARPIFQRGQQLLLWSALLLVALGLISSGAILWLLEPALWPAWIRANVVQPHQAPPAPPASNSTAVLMAETPNHAALQSQIEFISLVYHELRTPLVPVSGFIDYLLMTATEQLNDNQRKALHQAREQTTRLEVLLNDLLEISRYEAGAIHLRVQSVNLTTMLTDIVHSYDHIIRAKSMRVMLNLADLAPIQADPQRMAQALSNIVSNALKYTYAHGTITITTRELSPEQVEVRITDTGVGISPEQQRKLFTRFYRAENPLREQVSGTGLGLTIAKLFVELHGGQILVQSAIGQGSTFTIQLPYTQPST